MTDFPIDPVIIQKHAAIPGLIAELSYIDEGSAIDYMRVWGEKKKPISTMFEELSSELGQVATK